MPGKQVTASTLNSLLEQVRQAFAGQFQRTDFKVSLGGKPLDVSIYRMTDALVRVDFKTPKTKSAKAQKGSK